MDSRAAQDGQSGSRGWTVGPSVELTVTTLESWNLSILGTILPKLGRIFAADRLICYFPTPLPRRGPPRVRQSPGSAKIAHFSLKKPRRPTTDRRTPQAPRKARCTQPRRVGEPTGHVQHTCIPHRTTPRAHRRRTQSRTPHRHRRPHTDRQPRVHPPPLVPKPSLGPRRLTTLCPPSLAHRRWLGELG